MECIQCNIVELEFSKACIYRCLNSHLIFVLFATVRYGLEFLGFTLVLTNNEFEMSN